VHQKFLLEAVKTTMFSPSFEIDPEDSAVMDDFMNVEDTKTSTYSLQDAEIETEDFLLDHADMETLTRYTTTVDTEPQGQVIEGHYPQDVADAAITRPEPVPSTVPETGLLPDYQASEDFAYQGESSYGQQQEMAYHFTGSSFAELEDIDVTTSIVRTRFDSNTEYRSHMQQYVEDAHPRENISQSFDDMIDQLDLANDRTP